LVQQALEGLPGVKQAEASFAKKQAVVRYEPDKVTVEEMIAAIKHIGFSASLRE
jgi:copper chaperone CopZ